MIKLIVGVLLALGVAYLLFQTLPSPRPAEKVRGDLDTLFRHVLDSDRPDSFLIVSVRNTEDFVQLVPIPGGAQMDFPLITERQKGFEIANREGLQYFGADASFGSWLRW
jgi:hypothetical protein